jgi:serine/threonine-protein phosphatase 5
MVECEKIIKRDAFLKAIEVDDAPSVAEGLDIENMIVDPSYDGAKLGNEMTLEFIDDMIERFKNGKKIARKYVFQIILAVMDISKKEPTMIEHEVEEGSEITVCGDTHGKYSPRQTLSSVLIVSRPILRPHEHLQACRQAFREERIPLQR